MSNPATIYATGAVSRNPATEELIATYPYQTPDEVESTLSANAAAFRLWRTTPMSERVAAYRRLASTLRNCSEALASVITAEMGKTIGAARAEIEKSAATIDWLAEHGPAILADEPVTVDGDDEVHVLSADRHDPGGHALEPADLAGHPRVGADHVLR